VSRDPQTIEHEIEQARDELASTLDKLADRAGPKSVVRRMKEKATSPAGKAVMGAGAGALVALVALRIRNGRNSKKK